MKTLSAQEETATLLAANGINKDETHHTDKGTETRRRMKRNEYGFRERSSKYPTNVIHHMRGVATIIRRLADSHAHTDTELENFGLQDSSDGIDGITVSHQRRIIHRIRSRSHPAIRI